MQMILQQKRFKEVQLLKFPNVDYSSGGLYNILLITRHLRVIDLTGCTNIQVHTLGPRIEERFIL